MDTESQRVCNILSLAVPTMLFSGARSLQQSLNVIFIGLLNDPAKLAAVGMGNMVNNLVGMSCFFGFSAAMDTLQTQAAGAGNFELCGVYLHRARVIITGLFLVIIVLLLNVEKPLVMLGQDAKVAKYC